MTIDPATLPPADAEQAHLLDEVQHPEFVEAVQHEYADRCSQCGQPTASTEPLIAEQHVQVLRLIASGAANKGIAKHLNCTIAVAKNQVVALLRSMGAVNRAHAVAVGYETGLLTAGAVPLEAGR